MTDENDTDVAELQAYFNLFCDLLPLGNWRVTMQMANSHDMSHYVDTPEAYGACNKNRNMQYAEIYVNQEKPRVDSYGETWEVTLLHELFHVVLDEFLEYVEMKYPESYDDPFFQTKMERLINLLSYSFYNALMTNIQEVEDEQPAEVNFDCLSCSFPT
jgi:hypothetical protein